MILACGKHRTISPTRGVWAYATSLTPPRSNEAPVPSPESERSCICVLGVSGFASFYDISIGVWSCSESVVCFLFHYIHRYQCPIWNHSNSIRTKSDTRNQHCFMTIK